MFDYWLLLLLAVLKYCRRDTNAGFLINGFKTLKVNIYNNILNV